MLSKLVNRRVGIISTSNSDNTCKFEITNMRDIIEIIIPILTKFHFTSTKYLDFNDWKSAALIR